MRRRGGAASSTPFMASVLNMDTSLKSGFDGDIDVIGASVDAAEELGLADIPRAVRDADADVSIARHAHVEARVEVVEELPVAAAAPALVVLLHLADLLGIGKTRAEAEPRVEVAVPGEPGPVHLEEGHHRPVVVAVAFLEVPLQADEAGEVDRPAAGGLHQLPAERHGRDADVLPRIAR